MKAPLGLFVQKVNRIDGADGSVGRLVYRQKVNCKLPNPGVRVLHTLHRRQNERGGAPTITHHELS